MIKAVFLILFFLLLLSACSSQSGLDKGDKAKEQAIFDARNSSPEVHLAYLQCYALNYLNKNECTQALANRFIDEQSKNNPYYTKAFQYKAEKLGFLNFLQAYSLSCNAIDHGPKFIHTVKAYLVTCQNGNNYFLQFDYNNKKWKHPNP